MAVVVYDALLLLAVLFFATALVLPFNSGQAFVAGQYVYSIYLLVIGFVFYGWFWTKGGQTLGLRSWKLKLCRSGGGPVGWSSAGLAVRRGPFVLGMFGLGFYMAAVR